MQFFYFLKERQLSFISYTQKNRTSDICFRVFHLFSSDFVFTILTKLTELNQKPTFEREDNENQ